MFRYYLLLSSHEPIITVHHRHNNSNDRTLLRKTPCGCLMTDVCVYVRMDGWMGGWLMDGDDTICARSRIFLKLGSLSQNLIYNSQETACHLLALFCTRERLKLSCILTGGVRCSVDTSHTHPYEVMCLTIAVFLRSRSYSNALYTCL